MRNAGGVEVVNEEAEAAAENSARKVERALFCKNSRGKREEYAYNSGNAGSKTVDAVCEVNCVRNANDNEKSYNVVKLAKLYAYAKEGDIKLGGKTAEIRHAEKKERGNYELEHKLFARFKTFVLLFEKLARIVYKADSAVCKSECKAEKEAHAARRKVHAQERIYRHGKHHGNDEEDVRSCGLSGTGNAEGLFGRGRHRNHLLGRRYSFAALTGRVGRDF